MSVKFPFSHLDSQKSPTSFRYMGELEMESKDLLDLPHSELRVTACVSGPQEPGKVHG
jgi:hypothetical protein